jgi:predicted phosphodiesterase
MLLFCGADSKNQSKNGTSKPCDIDPIWDNRDDHRKRRIRSTNSTGRVVWWSRRPLGVDPVARRIDVFVSGHFHAPKVQTVGGVLYLNPGSAGRRRFKLPIMLAKLDATPDGLRPAIHDLGDG